MKPVQTGKADVSFQPLHSPAGFRRGRDAGAGDPRDFFLPAPQHRPLPRRRNPRTHHHHGLQGGASRIRRTGNHPADRRGGQHRSGDQAHFLHLPGRSLQHRRRIHAGDQDQRRRSGNARQSQCHPGGPSQGSRGIGHPEARFLGRSGHLAGGAFRRPRCQGPHHPGRQAGEATD